MLAAITCATIVMGKMIEGGGPCHHRPPGVICSNAAMQPLVGCAGWDLLHRVHIFFHPQPQLHSIHSVLQASHLDVSS